MFVVAMIPPIVDGDATILDMDDTLSIVCYWVLPYTVLGIAGAISAVFPPWFDKHSAEVDQRTATAPPVAAPAARRPGGHRGRRSHHRGAGATAGWTSRSRRRSTAAAPARPVEVTTSGNDLFGRRWRSGPRSPCRRTASSTSRGRPPQGVDGQDPDWSAADGTAPIWAMRFDDDDATPEMFVPPAEPWQLTIEASGVGAIDSTESGTAGRPVTGRRTVLRRTGAAGLRYEPTTIGGLPGMLVLPAGEPPDAGWPAVACFGGSEGGFESQLSNAAVLASHGFARPRAGLDLRGGRGGQRLRGAARAVRRRADICWPSTTSVDRDPGRRRWRSPGAPRVCSPRSAAAWPRRCVAWCWSARAA